MEYAESKSKPYTPAPPVVKGDCLSSLVTVSGLRTRARLHWPPLRNIWQRAVGIAETLALPPTPLGA